VEEYSDAELLAAAGRGNGDAFGVLFRRHVRPITGYAVRRCDNADDVADLVSDTFMIALGAAHRYVPQTETALPWLFGIARRVHTRQRRRTKSFLRLVSKNTNAQVSYAEEETAAIESAIDAARAGNEMREAMTKLSTGEREVLELVAIDGLTPSEAALVLDLTPNAARLKLSRARRTMQRLLRDELHPSFEQEVGGAY
jgi:RNA polymerase sigma-70 factor (ECF subfamily)